MKEYLLFGETCIAFLNVNYFTYNNILANKIRLYYNFAKTIR